MTIWTILSTLAIIVLFDLVVLSFFHGILARRARLRAGKKDDPS
jgi:hypothetical protein